MHACRLKEGQTGSCRVRTNRGGKIRSDSYGAVTSLALDPIEKKPLNRFHPGSCILSVGSFGCNMHCPFCQNAEISQVSEKSAEYVRMTPEELASKASALVPEGNIGVAYTYNEPLTFWEFVRDTSVKVHAADLLNVMVSNGMASDAVLDRILPLIDAWNIDVKTFREDLYEKWGGSLAAVKNTVIRAHEHAHVELTMLIIPGENDSTEEMKELSSWIADISPDIPLHISRFFPRWKMKDREPTPVERIYALAETAGENLKYVYRGNC